MPMKHRSTSSIISSLVFASLAVPSTTDEQINNAGPSQETICALQLLARTYHPKTISPTITNGENTTFSEEGWLNEHPLSGKAV